MLVRLRRGYVQWVASGGYVLLIFVGAQLESPLAWKWVAVAIAAMALPAWGIVLRRARAVADTPTSRIASAAQGYVELLGRGQPLAGVPLHAPLNGLPCLWYRFKVERKRDDKWHQESSGESSDSFLLDDGSGLCVVDPEGAEVLPRSTDVWYPQPDYRHTQAVLIPGEQIYALGAFRTWGSDNVDLNVAEDVKHLLAEWKKDMPKLLERFDLDGDGTLDLREWQLARSQAKREVLRNHRELRAAPDTHAMGAPADGRLFLVSSLPPEKIQRRYLLWAAGHLAVFFTALWGVAHYWSAG
jgi:hypothetical protein